MVAKPVKENIKLNESHLELYSLLGEEYMAIKEGRFSTLEEVQ